MSIGTKKNLSDRDIDDHAKLILVLLNEEPYSRKAILERIRGIGLRFGSTEMIIEDVEKHLSDNGEKEIYCKMEEQLDFLLAHEIIREANGLYYLTESGQEYANKYSKGMFTFFKVFKVLGSPTIPSILSLFFHLFLGFIKLIGFIITGSVGLLGDGIDSAIDGISSLAVTIAIKIKKEATITYLLIFLMIASGIGILIESVQRLLNPAKLKDQNIAIIVALFSIVLCSILYFYQRLVGVNQANLTILAQSEDSKNHILVGSFVLIAILATYFKLYFLDGAVGCLIAILILQGANDLWQDARAISQGENIDYEKYKLGIAKHYDEMQEKVLENWILWRVQKGIDSYPKLEQDFKQDFQAFKITLNDQKQELLGRYYTRESLRQQIMKLINAEFLKGEGEVITITEKGLERLRRTRRKEDRKRKRKRKKRSGF